MSNLGARLNYCWRVIATGLSFIVFGIGGVLLSLTLFPLARLLSRNPDETHHHTQYVMHTSWRLFIWFMKITGILTWELRGGERLLQPGRLVVCNHPSLLDVVFMISFMPKVDCIVKTGIYRNPFMRWPAAWAGYIASDDPQTLIAVCAERLRRGHSLLVFPEGTRSQPGQAIHMKRGAAQIALAAEAEILPVTLTVVPTTLTKGKPWYHIPPRRFHVTVSVDSPVRAADFVPADGNRSLAARHLTEHLEQYFTTRVAQLTDEQGDHSRRDRLLAL